jgi:hypothetical protein
MISLKNNPGLDLQIANILSLDVNKIEVVVPFHNSTETYQAALIEVSRSKRYPKNHL